MSPALPAPPSSDTIRRALAEFKVPVNDAQIVQIQRYIALLLKWNEAMNLTAIHDPLEILYRHFCESMFGSGLIPVGHGRLADVGSGGGFPGLPLKIACPELEVCLIDSNVKKATFLAEVVRELALPKARVLVSRYEELDEEVTPLDIACSRAVGEFAQFLGWAASERIGARTVMLWISGRDLDEVRASIDWKWQEPVPIPQSLRRFVLIGTRVELPAPRD
ncbi:MAG TPA: 16S rRNA (guanine(527)-N(7))-methyltransferase RsmG [Candidatus Sulfotelmatobacter sp.]|nr:16S rRNA (guanine(527)-N(7))-methyltransferase RsmG [Candidatus Sulfotelmatobacter sp.]